MTSSCGTKLLSQPMMTSHQTRIKSQTTLKKSIKVDQFPLTKRRLNTLRPRQDGRHFPDDTFKLIFLNEKLKNLKSFQNTLEGSNWDSIWTGENSDEICENFYNHVLKSLTNASHFPVNPEKDLKTKNGLQVAWGTAFRRSTFCIKNNWNPLMKKPEWITKYIKTF